MRERLVLSTPSSVGSLNHISMFFAGRTYSSLQQAKQAEVKIKVEVGLKSDSFDLGLDLSLNLPESWQTFSASC
jgi:hypothetical protein